MTAIFFKVIKLLNSFRSSMAKDTVIQTTVYFLKAFCSIDLGGESDI